MCARVANHTPPPHLPMLRDLEATQLPAIPKPRVRRVLTNPTKNRALAVAWYADSVHAVCSYHGGAVILWDTVAAQAVQYIKRPFAMSVAMCPDVKKRLVAVGGLDNAVSIIDMSEGIENCEIEKVLPCPDGQGHEGLISALAFLDCQTLVSASGDGDLRSWDVERGVSIHTFKGHSCDVKAIALSAPTSPAAHPSFIASGSLDATVRLWDARSGQATHVLQAAAEVSSVSAFPSGALVAAARADGTVSIFDVRSSGAVGELTTADAPSCTGLEWSISGRALYTSHPTGEVRVWNAFGPDASCVHKVPVVGRGGRDQTLSGLAISPDGAALASGCHDGALRVVAVGKP